jgi:hypothetical protein
VSTDLRAERRAEERDKVTLADAFKAFEIARDYLRPHTLYEYGLYVKVAFKEWKDRPLKRSRKTGLRSVTRS